MECDLRTLDPKVGLTPECFRLFHSFQVEEGGERARDGLSWATSLATLGSSRCLQCQAEPRHSGRTPPGGFLSRKSSWACLRRHLASRPPQPVSHVCSGLGRRFPFNRRHQGGGAFLSAEVRRAAQRVSCCQGSKRWRLHCCYRGQKVCRGGQRSTSRQRWDRASLQVSRKDF